MQSQKGRHTEAEYPLSHLSRVTPGASGCRKLDQFGEANYKNLVDHEEPKQK